MILFRAAALWAVVLGGAAVIKDAAEKHDIGYSILLLGVACLCREGLVSLATPRGGE